MTQPLITQVEGLRGDAVDPLMDLLGTEARINAKITAAAMVCNAAAKLLSTLELRFTYVELLESLPEAIVLKHALEEQRELYQKHK